VSLCDYLKRQEFTILTQVEMLSFQFTLRVITLSRSGAT